MTLLGRFFRPWELSSSINEDQEFLLCGKLEKEKSIKNESFLPCESSTKKRKTGNNSSYSANGSNLMSLTCDKIPTQQEIENCDISSVNNNSNPHKSKTTNFIDKGSNKITTSGSKQFSHSNGLHNEREVEDHSAFPEREMLLAHSALPTCYEPISPTEFDLFYSGNSSSLFLYPNSNTLNELASLSRQELTAMGLLPPEQASSLKVRKQRPKRFHCPHCQVAFSNNGQLRGHIRIHTGERPFVCEEEGCGKSFTRNEELTRHRRIHSGVRPFPCSYCGKKFGRKDHLKKHTRTHQRGVYNSRSAALIGYANPFQQIHQNLLSPSSSSSTSFVTAEELITLQSQYSAFPQQRQQSLLPISTAASTSMTHHGPLPNPSALNAYPHSSYYHHPFNNANYALQMG